VTIAEWLCATKSRTARLLLQDRAAAYGAQYEIREPFELLLRQAESKDKILHEDTE
jgi:hypothetical protein